MDFWRALRDTLELKGYRVDRSCTGTGQAFVGKETINDLVIDTKIIVLDSDFITRPVFFITSLEKRDGLVPHLDEANNFCYAAPESLILDRHDPGGSILLCRDIFLSEAERALSGKHNDEIVDELPSYWRGIKVSSDIPNDYEGKATLYCWHSKGSIVNVLSHSSSLPEFYRQHCDESRGFQEIKFDAVLIRYEDIRPFQKFHREYRTLKDFLSWLREFGDGVAERVISAFASSSIAPVAVFLNGEQGAYGMLPGELPFQSASGSPRYRPQDGEFRTKRGRKLALQAYAQHVEVKRFIGRDVKDAYVYGRSLIQRGTLEGKKICIVGCGTIGGHLSKFAAQSGAGSGDGSILMLVDNQCHEPGNVGRHILGYEALGHNKAVAVKRCLDIQYPGKNITATAKDVSELFSRLNEYDLVVDATGDETLSNAINRRFSAKRGESETSTFLYVWLAGLGAAAQALLVDDPEKACYRCLAPEFGGTARYSPLKNDKDSYFVAATCSDGPYIPYSVAAAATAAGLALELMLDWATGDPKKKLRTRLIDTDPEVTRNIKDSSPVKHQKCPVCNSTI